MTLKEQRDAYRPQLTKAITEMARIDYDDPYIDEWVVIAQVRTPEAERDESVCYEFFTSKGQTHAMSEGLLRTGQRILTEHFEEVDE